ncbi:procollagen-lysine,2-oxoglutarate 5-dioxygenase 1-like [Paramacrobiotus metropolitanus]|uniref:procollagen-lysine,2-oxoglutarate 5-dioxygenase 1-like n=1 Tax=Paramacrobiotus metropolitanus TaxID=2943436 RepID=UPI002445DE12|nr:procollagen-lysine,2-oxoglutarate 5-dioxygenase 1-like [Paramacrobiotus metropolitanus]
MLKLLGILVLCLFGRISTGIGSEAEHELLVVTVASNATNGFERFMRSAKVYGYTVEVLGMNQPWKGGDMTRAGGGYKINLLKTFMDTRKDDAKTIYLVTDSYDVMFSAPARSVLDLFLERKYKILFSAEPHCWPNRELASHYPPVLSSSKYLNSGGFMGNGKSISEMLAAGTVSDLDDDQLYYTKLFLDPNQRKDLGIVLDTENEIFQTLYDLDHTVKIRFRDDDAYVFNIEHNTEPAVVHGNGLSKGVLNQMGNYLAKSWTPTLGCLACNESEFKLESLSEMPKLTMGLFIEKPTPFLKEWFERIAALDYPKKHINVFIHNNEKYHEKDVARFIKSAKDYLSVTSKGPEDGMTEAEARTTGIKECLKEKCDYYLSVDSEAMLTNVETIRLLLQQNRTVLAPMMTRPGKMWSNFWGALSYEGFYSRSEDYGEILDYSKMGIWNVPFISTAYMIRKDAIDIDFPLFTNPVASQDFDMIWCKEMRDKGKFLFVTNQQYYGHLVNADNFDIKLKKPDFYQLIDNKPDWEYRYIHQDYHKMKELDTVVEQPCTDVYWFPVVSERYCKDLIEIMENFGQWSSGNNEDKRLQGGYENVPTRDIHMNQVGLERQWMMFLKEYIRPMQEKLYTGYFHDPPHALMNFVVRYRPDEQPALRPHHDSSTYTINIALNRPNVDYEGGGCRFIRYNCSVTDTRLGWTLIHPGRLTHFHEGLPVTKGTRYIMISFVDP